jgi:hypothetical protein
VEASRTVHFAGVVDAAHGPIAGTNKGGHAPGHHAFALCRAVASQTAAIFSD